MAEDCVIVTMAQEHMIGMEGVTSSVHGSNEYCTASFGTDWEFRDEVSGARLMKCGSDLGYEIEASREHGSQMESDTDLEAEFDTLEAEIAAENVKVFRSLQEQWPGGFFRDGGDEWVLARKIAEGGWAEVFEAQFIGRDGRKSSTPWVLKVLKKSISLRYLQTLLPLGMLQNDHLKRCGRYWNGYSCSIYGGILLKNGRFAFQMTRFWGDLRQLIDIKLQHNHNRRRSPFTDDKTVTKCMLDIAEGMLALHNDNIIHRDLNASSVQIRPLDKDFDTIHGRFDCKVTGFESSVGVVGTGFWRAPEILLGVKNQDIKPDLFSKKSDVYSYAMTCSEILTGSIPFEDHRQSDYDAVLQDERPKLPTNIKPWMEALLKRCWHREPSERPTFKEIVEILKEKSGKTDEKYDVFSQQASTWGELNDPRRVATTGVHETDHVELKADFPILVQKLEVALQRCEEKARELSQQNEKVEVFRFQCAHLVDAVSAGVDDLFRQFPQLLECTKEPMIPGTDLWRWFKCIKFGIHSVVDLTHKLQSVMEILSACSAKEWWRTALRLSTTPPHPQLPRWSMFGLALRQCEWSMDIVQYAIMKTRQVSRDHHVAGLESDIDSSFKWCEKRQRLALQCGDPSRSESEEYAASLNVAVALEAKDRVTLVESLENLKTKRLADGRWYQMFLPGLQQADVDIASFLMLKLRGPVPQASYLPYSVKIDHAANLVFRREFAVGASGTSVSEYKWCDEIVAVKRVCCKGSRRLRFEEEAAALAAVQHPNVVQLMGCAFREKDEMLMLVMEYMEEDLRVIIERRCPNPGQPGSSPPFPLIVAIDIMLQIAEGMQFLREHKIMHGDLKAKNVLVNTAYRLLDYPLFNEGEVPKRLSYLLTHESYYVVKLADFGEARYMPFESNHVVTRMSGTLRWMAPEMVYIRSAEVPSEYNWRADVYSYALTCYEILTGHVPFHDFAYSTLRDSRERPGLHLGEGLPPNLVNLIERCLDKTPEKRPTFAEICKDLWQCKVEITTSIFRLS
jgi:serine/threonine protein kinase